MSAYPGQFTPDPATTMASEHASSEVRDPSEVTQPRKVETKAQQGSTQPGDGSEVHTDGHRHNGAAGASAQEKVPFKEQVVGVAQKTRGTLLGKPDLKEHGEQILQGNTTHEADR